MLSCGPADSGGVRTGGAAVCVYMRGGGLCVSARGSGVCVRSGRGSRSVSACSSVCLSAGVCGRGSMCVSTGGGSVCVCVGVSVLG